MAEVEQQIVNPRPFKRGLDLGLPHAAASQPVEDLPLPARVVLPMKQHAGGRCEARVSVGDEVKVGQVLGESADLLSAPVHATVSGRVEAVEDRIDASGRKSLAVVIENDGRDEWETPPTDNPEFAKQKLSALVRAVRASGVVDPYTGRPVHSMLAPPERPKSYIFLVGIPVIKPLQLLLVNALDAEPTMAANQRLLVERAEDLGEAIKATARLAGVKNTVLAVNQDSPGVSTASQTAAADGVRLMAIKNRYPVAFPEMLTTAVTGRELPWPGGEPRDAGVMTLDVETVLALYDALRTGRPQIDRVVTVVGPEMTPRNLRVRLGVPLGDVAAFAGGSYERAAKVVAGGLMNGMAQYTPEAPVDKMVRALHIQGADELSRFSEHLCIKCGRCVSVCPVRILPNVIANLSEFGHFDEAEAAEMDKCIECGCCAYVCPAKRPMVHYIKHGKAEAESKRAAQ